MTKPVERTSTPQHSKNILWKQVFCSMLSDLRPLEN